jgi:YD repeat-containing protein
MSTERRVALVLVCLAAWACDRGRRPGPEPPTRRARAETPRSSAASRRALAPPSAAAPATGPTYPGPCTRTEDDDVDGTIDARTHYHYDAAGRLVREEIDAQEIGLDEGGEECCVDVMREADGRVDAVVTYEYDARGRLATIEDDPNADGRNRRVIRIERDAQDRERARIEHYQWRGRLRRASVTRSSYDGDRLVREEREDDGQVVHVVRHEYDAAGRRIRTTEGQPGRSPREETVYEYDADGRVVSKTWTEHGSSRPTVRVTTYEHDAVGRVVREHGYNGTVETVYDAAGNPIRQDDSDGPADAAVRVRWDYACWRRR